MGRNVETAEQAASLCNELRAGAPDDLPLMVTVDQEGGRVQRLKGTRWPTGAALGAGSVERTEAAARAIGAELAAIGVGMDFAPVLDVLTEPKNTVIGDRAFGSNAEHVATHGLAFMRGLRASGVAACGKHFPGHGGVIADSHLELPRHATSREQLTSVDVLPFARAAAAGVDAIMTAHVVYDAFDAEAPATLSRSVIGDLLRGQLGYEGVVVTDDLGMKAVSEGRVLEEAVAFALAAGADMMLICDAAEERRVEAFETLHRLQDADPYLQRLVATSAARIAALKSRLPRGPVDVAAAAAIVGCEAHRKLAAG
jgi:beta-N-acetylhexosaminidase